MKVKTPKEDPTAKSAREREERRADAAFIENTANLLSEEERRRVRRFGRRAPAVRVAGQAGSAAGGASAGGAAMGGGGSFDPGGFGGFGGGSLTDFNSSAF